MNSFNKRLLRLDKENRLIRVGDSVDSKIRGKIADVGANQYNALTGQWTQRIENFLFGRAVRPKDPNLRRDFQGKIGQSGASDEESSTSRKVFLILRDGHPRGAKEMVFIANRAVDGHASQYKCVMAFTWDAANNDFRQVS